MNALQHLTADEKHTWMLGNKTYVATTDGEDCILGAAVAKDAIGKALIDAYQVYKKEARCIKPKMNRRLYTTQYFHGSMDAVQLRIRGRTLIHNFGPYNPRIANLLIGLKSSTERLNHLRYHKIWLHKLYASASLGGCQSPPLNPI